MSAVEIFKIEDEEQNRMGRGVEVKAVLNYVYPYFKANYRSQQC